MAILTIPNADQKSHDFLAIKDFLAKRGIWHDRWRIPLTLADEATQEEILEAYSGYLKPFMLQGGYTTADVISVNSQTQDLLALRNKFLKEHTHTEDEVRFFVDGQGLFWFHVHGEVFSLLCQAGDLISVPANSRHWFDLGDRPSVKAIRIFIDSKGWIPHYTNSGIDEKYNPKY